MAATLESANHWPCITNHWRARTRLALATSCSDAELTRLDAKLIAATAGDPKLPSSDETWRVFDDLRDARARRHRAEDRMVECAVRGIAPAILIFLIWRAVIWVGSAFARK